ncbi:DUF4870 domain-containing protein [Zooshikella sp. WH53]|uniref:DUF4870 domain-containing protein n=1 Tax=Zooshikella harenae TaxID=2827238 RepID=A0ABS5ZI93_9GAMM|nr:DUF4870 domain-containing protein [Zooshikella harenae]
MGHVLSLSYICGFLFTLAYIIAPLIIWSIKKDEYAFVDD